MTSLLRSNMCDDQIHVDEIDEQMAELCPGNATEELCTTDFSHSRSGR